MSKPAKKEKKPTPFQRISGNWGPVRVIKGPHKGKVGYYDDDTYVEIGGGWRPRAIVYFGVPFEGPRAFLLHSQLEIVDETVLPLERFARDNPFIANQVGIVTKR